MSTSRSLLIDFLHDPKSTMAESLLAVHFLLCTDDDCVLVLIEPICDLSTNTETDDAIEGLLSLSTSTFVDDRASRSLGANPPSFLVRGDFVVAPSSTHLSDASQAGRHLSES